MCVVKSDQLIKFCQLDFDSLHWEAFSIFKILWFISLHLFPFSAYITEEGKTKVNIFFKSTEFIQVTKIRIKVSHIRNVELFLI